MIEEIEIKTLNCLEDYNEVFYINLITEDDDINNTLLVAKELNLTCEDYVIKLIQNGAIYPADEDYEGFFFKNKNDCQRFIDTVIWPLVNEINEINEMEKLDDIFSYEFIDDCCKDEIHYVKINNLINDNDIINFLKISKNKYNEIMEDHSGVKFNSKTCTSCEYKEDNCRLPKVGYYFEDEDDIEDDIEELKKYYFALKEKETKKEEIGTEKLNQNIIKTKKRRIFILED